MAKYKHNNKNSRTFKASNFSTYQLKAVKKF